MVLVWGGGWFLGHDDTLQPDLMTFRLGDQWEGETTCAVISDCYFQREVAIDAIGHVRLPLNVSPVVNQRHGAISITTFDAVQVISSRRLNPVQAVKKICGDEKTVSRDVPRVWATSTGSNESCRARSRKLKDWSPMAAHQFDTMVQARMTFSLRLKPTEIDSTMRISPCWIPIACPQAGNGCLWLV